MHFENKNSIQLIVPSKSLVLRAVALAVTLCVVSVFAIFRFTNDIAGVYPLGFDFSTLVYIATFVLPVIATAMACAKLLRLRAMARTTRDAWKTTKSYCVNANDALVYVDDRTVTARLYRNLIAIEVMDKFGGSKAYTLTEKGVTEGFKDYKEYYNFLTYLHAIKNVDEMVRDDVYEFYRH